MNKIIYYLQRVYRLTLSLKKQEEVVWNELKKLHSGADWKYGVYEKDKYIEAVFELGNDQGGAFYYMIYDGCFHCRVKILEDYSVQFTTDLFILAAHFNNLLNNGIVVVNVNEQYVEYHLKKDLIVPLLDEVALHGQVLQHYVTAKDIYSAFQRLVDEQEAPAIIIADLLKSKEEKEEGLS